MRNIIARISGGGNPLNYLLSFLLVFTLVPVAWADTLDTSLFAKKINFTVSGYAGASTLANFPVLVRLSDVSGFNFSDFTTPVDELRFTDATGNNLNYEIDTWDSDAGKALVWVSVPSLFGTASGTTTEIRAYFAPSSTSGLPAVSSNAVLPAVSSNAVWSAAGYYGVWHMNEANATDSSANHLDGTADASITVVDAKIGAGANFPSNAKIATTNTPNAAFTSAFSFETWARPSEVTGEYALFGKEALVTFKIKGGKTRFTTPGKQDFDNVTAPVSANAWYHLVVAFVPKQAAKVYVNGALDKSQTDTKGFNDLVNSFPIVFGSNQWNQYYKGILDECRLVTAALSDDWIAQFGDGFPLGGHLPHAKRRHMRELLVPRGRLQPFGRADGHAQDSLRNSRRRIERRACRVRHGHRFGIVPCAGQGSFARHELFLQGCLGAAK